MEQAKDPKMPLLGPTLTNTDPVTVEDLVYQLCSKKADAPMLSKDKKLFLSAVLKNKKELLLQCKTLDMTIGTSLYSGLSSLMPINTRVITREASNADLAQFVAQLLYPMKQVRDHILSQYKLERTQMSHNTRSSANENPKPTPILQLLNQSFELLEKLEKCVCSHRSVPTVDTAVMPVKLSALQRQRKFSEELVPIPTQLQLCAMCGHESTNLPPENQAVIDYNDKKEKEFQESVKAWDSYMQKVSNGDKNSKKPKGLKRRPHRRGAHFKEPIIVCKCSVSYCLGNSDEQCNSCPIKCSKINMSIKNEVGCVSSDKDGRYPFLNDGGRKYCSCPICMCKCSFACKINDVPKILLWRRVQGKDVSTDFKVASSMGYGTKAPVFFQDIFKESAKICYKTIKQQDQAEKLRKKYVASARVGSIMDSDNELNIENRGVVAACEFAATNIASKSQALTMLTRKEMKKSLGSPCTKVQLPSGDFFDTKLIAGSNQHSTNNKLGGDIGGPHEEFTTHAGMKSNIDIDWSIQSNDYIDFIDKYAVTKKSLNEKKTQEASIMLLDNSSSDDEVQIVEVMKVARNTKYDKERCILNKDRHILKPAAIQLAKKIKTEPTTEKRNDILENMHSRVITKARSQLTSAIKKTLENKSDETKIKARKLKSTVLMIEKSEMSKSNINIIKAVTSDGKELEIDNVNSEEILERVSLYHDLENET